MLENVLFFINIQKIAMSARCSFIFHQTSAFVILLSEIYFITQQFCWWECKVWFCPPTQDTLATLLILILLVF